MPKIASGTVHNLPTDVRQTLINSTPALATWNDLTPLARNEWICWVVSVKKSETRQKHLTRMAEELEAGERRPCCWMGCIHRTDKAISPSVKYITGR